jgi:drug/metabolite transporter (DMT)-like permease
MSRTMFIEISQVEGSTEPRTAEMPCLVFLRASDSWLLPLSAVCVLFDCWKARSQLACLASLWSYKQLVRSQAVLLQILASLMFSTGGLMIKLITISPQAVVGVRGAIAAIVIAFFMSKPRFTWSLSQIGGAIAIFAAQLFFVLATRQTTAANAVFIQYTAPVYVAFLGIWYLRERIKPIDWLSLMVVIAGLLLFFAEKLDAVAIWGNINALISGVALAWLFLFLRKQKNGSTIETVFLGNALAAVVCLTFIFFEEPTTTDWLALVFLGVFQLGLPFILLSISIKRLTAIEAILIQTLEPIFNPVWVFLVISEKPSNLALLGGLLVLGAVTVRALVMSRAEVKQKQEVSSQ